MKMSIWGTLRPRHTHTLNADPAVPHVALCLGSSLSELCKSAAETMQRSMSPLAKWPSPTRKARLPNDKMAERLDRLT